MRRVVAVAVVAGVLVGGAVAGGVAAASGGGAGDPPGSSASGAGGLSTAAVVRTDLASTVQVGGSIAFDGSYTVVIPSGVSTQQVAQAQQQLTQAEEGRANDGTINDYAATQDQDALTNAQNTFNSAEATLSADEARQTQDCAGRGASSSACAQDAEKVSQDHQQVNEANQQLASAQLNVAPRSHPGPGQDPVRPQPDRVGPGQPGQPGGHRGHLGGELHLAAHGGRGDQRGPAGLRNRQPAGAAVVRFGGRLPGLLCGHGRRRRRGPVDPRSDGPRVSGPDWPLPTTIQRRRQRPWSAGSGRWACR